MLVFGFIALMEGFNESCGGIGDSRNLLRVSFGRLA
jgi:hypothetical protein